MSDSIDIYIGAFVVGLVVGVLLTWVIMSTSYPAGSWANRVLTECEMELPRHIDCILKAEAAK